MMKKITRYQALAENMTNGSRKSVTINLDNTVDLTKTSFRLVNGTNCINTNGNQIFNNSLAVVGISTITSTSITLEFANSAGNTFTLMAIVEVLEY